MITFNKLGGTINIVTRFLLMLKVVVFIMPVMYTAWASHVSFTYWPYELEGCKNTKDTFLKETSKITRVSYTTRRRRPCNVYAGRWVDYFTDKDITLAEDVIVAPIIPLSHIKKLTTNWGTEQFLNYVHDKSALISFKRGSAGEKMYLENSNGLESIPTSQPGRCETIGMWMDTKIRWNIPFMEGEKRRLFQKAMDCVSSGSYHRLTVFGGWSKPQGHKCDTRAEVLRRDSITPVINTEPTHFCSTKLEGKWNDHYLGVMQLESTRLDIDHVVPLKHAYQKGAWKWPKWKKKNYVNYMKDPFHLLAVDYSENRKKADKGPEGYMPPNGKFHCEYLQIWVGIKLRWGLRVRDEEKDFITHRLKYCENIDHYKIKKVLAMLAMIKNFEL
ncbi:MAG: HNH endonuclease [Bacteriovoracaceae bacterium]|nr:HNH endonuclease [Bacteriovoracaceae bacterium]